MSAAPKLEVITNITLLKSTVLPVELVSLPSSITCNKTCSTSGAAFSTSSSSNTQLGVSSISLIS